MASGPVSALLVLLTIGLPLVFLARRLRVGALVAYLLTGAIAGQLALVGGGHWWVLGTVTPANIAPMASIGAALLLFSLGLELDLPGMRASLRQVLVSASVQIALTLGVGICAALAAGTDGRSAFAIGCCLSMSSTLVVLRTLEERRLRHRPEGRTVIGLLLAQDLCLAPMLAILALVGHGVGGESRQALWSVLAAIIGCLVLTILARRLLATPLLAHVRALALPEIEVAFAVIVALGAAWMTESAGLGAAVGAFCAGLALGGDEHRHAVETSTRPLQGLLAIVFFASMGVLLDVRFVAAHALAVLGVLALTLLGKALLAAVALRLAGLSGRSSLGGGIMMAQLGEFSFVIAATAFGTADTFLGKMVVSVTGLSLIVTPALIQWAERFLPRSPLEDITGIGATIVVAGLGPVGNTVVEALRESGHPLLLVDRNRNLLRLWENAPGVQTHFGRIEDMEDWIAVLGHRPALVVLTFPIPDASALVAARLRQIDPSLVIIARSPYEGQVDLLHQAGAQFVICDERETTRALLPILRKALELVGQQVQDRIPTTRVDRTARQRRERPQSTGPG